MNPTLVVVGLGLISCVFACSGGEGGGAPAVETGTDTSATEPARSDAPAPAAPSSDGAPERPSVLGLSPSCGKKGDRIVLKLGLTRDHRVPDCYKVEDARVSFAPDEHAKITLMGPTSDGFCALDVQVPEEAESGKVTVAIGKDTFESDVVFGVPCP